MRQPDDADEPPMPPAPPIQAPIPEAVSTRPLVSPSPMRVGDANSVNGTQIKPLTITTRKGTKSQRLIMPMIIHNNTLQKGKKNGLSKLTRSEKNIQKAYWNDVKNTMPGKTFTWTTSNGTVVLNEEAINTILNQF